MFILYYMYLYTLELVDGRRHYLYIYIYWILSINIAKNDLKIFCEGSPWEQSLFISLMKCQVSLHQGSTFYILNLIPILIKCSYFSPEKFTDFGAPLLTHTPTRAEHYKKQHALPPHSLHHPCTDHGSYN